MINNFNLFLFNSLLEGYGSNRINLIFSERFENILKDIDSFISHRLLSLNGTDNPNTKRLFIDIDENVPDRITFLMNNKIDDVLTDEEIDSIYNSDVLDKAFNSNLRSSIRLSSFINELFNNHYISVPLTPEEKKYNKEQGIKTDAQLLDEFIDQYKARTSMNGLFELVSGKDVINWYDQSNYLNKSTGTLGNSCMKSNECKEYIKFYSKNKNKVSLLILKDNENQDKIIGRALVWKLSEPNRIFMDRIYTTHQYDIEKFKSYASKNGWLYKYSQNSISTEYIYDPITKTKKHMDLIVHGIKPSEYYPYVDTIKYFSEETNTLSNKVENLDMTTTLYLLEDATGGYLGGETIKDMKEKVKSDYLSNNGYDIFFSSDTDEKKLINKYFDYEPFLENLKVKIKDNLRLLDRTFMLEDKNRVAVVANILNISSYEVNKLSNYSIDNFIKEEKLEDKVIEYYINIWKTKTPSYFFNNFFNSSYEPFLDLISPFVDTEKLIDGIIEKITLETLFEMFIYSPDDY